MTLVAVAEDAEGVAVQRKDAETLGRQITRAEIATAVNDLAEYLTGQRPTYSDPQIAGSYLVNVIGKRISWNRS